MKAMYAAFLATAVIAVGAWYTLGEIGFSASDRSTGNAVRLDDG
ncbi:hypothetical protein [Roseovarius rhodophyticola]|uniref:Uncharacterized protein n=1 Tax=Roseovarius rhodophyticola TaxID=3080827 RepID=A0ABZ2TD91_9RHOB|nr:hypothetical protein [Roseovarius sp. W115]MDV2930789.1 hypothetical protein [Roseovarius sp. W115]